MDQSESVRHRKGAGGLVNAAVVRSWGTVLYCGAYLLILFFSGVYPPPLSCDLVVLFLYWILRAFVSLRDHESKFFPFSSHGHLELPRNHAASLSRWFHGGF